MSLQVEVVFSPRQGEVDHCSLSMAEGSTVAEALQRSGVLDRHPGLQSGGFVLGVWGRRCDPQQPLRDRDRVEIYRGLVVDPKEARRRRQQTQPKPVRRPVR